MAVKMTNCKIVLKKSQKRNEMKQKQKGTNKESCEMKQKQSGKSNEMMQSPKGH